MSTFLLNLCFYELGPTITNLSLSISLFLGEFFHRHSNKIFPAFFKKKHLHPLISPQLSFEFKPQLHLQNSRKRCCLSYSITYLLTPYLFILLTGFFILKHESTLLKIHNGLILAMDLGEDTSLILLHSSAALDNLYCRSFHHSHSSSKLIRP